MSIGSVLNGIIRAIEVVGVVAEAFGANERKREELLQLARHRQADQLPPHCCLAEFHNGYYECDFVSPWSISAHNVNAELMLIAQDWASSKFLNKPRNEELKNIGQKWSSRTNTNLRAYLEFMHIQFSETYATNLFPFIKCGEVKAAVPLKDLLRCAENYAIPHIEIVSPRMAICLGKETYIAVCCAAGLEPMPWPRPRNWNEATLPHNRIGSVEIYGAPHPGQLGTNNAGGKDVVVYIWMTLAEHLQNLRARS